ncbi:PaaI family thioesterase [Paracoccus alkenifer]|uniref:Acyl-coenzyme A thioesterase PaaI, contains HGG motif n=1 Tax=Paracoccus alkenifer TaxID=65735 RepID=A0A1H6L5C1_9RHOB|nr:PaaI family thioesterase [Paracoccus alkenifer]SEH81096.1 Acyl-coenzyme A thioesterase PaaI, contains HGG motif [Paracoccus alkenifer]
MGLTRESVIDGLLAKVPYFGWLGVQVDRRGDELTTVLPFAGRLIGNPALPALHGGVTAAFLETAALVELVWTAMGDERGGFLPIEQDESMPRLPKTIDFTIDYLRSGLARDAYARGRVVRLGRRYASVQVEAWQENRSRLFAQATGHFLMPQPRD